MEKTEPNLLTSSEVLSNIRDLIVHLHRSNGAKAESIVTDVVAHLKQVMTSGADPASPEMLRAQQTMFAVDEVRTLLSQQDYTAAAVAARDAAKEWKQPV